MPQQQPLNLNYAPSKAYAEDPLIKEYVQYTKLPGKLPPNPTGHQLKLLAHMMDVYRMKEQQALDWIATNIPWALEPGRERPRRLK